jgi:AGZA family xanthine/uracil permease-like MFS transporter
LLALFFLPLVEPLQAMKFAYCPALVAVGVLMMTSVTKVDFGDLTEALPAFATIAMMVFTYNIANGITAGLLLYVVVKLLAGRRSEINSGSIVFALLSLIYFAFGLPH